MENEEKRPWNIESYVGLLLDRKTYTYVIQDTSWIKRVFVRKWEFSSLWFLQIVLPLYSLFSPSVFVSGVCVCVCVQSDGWLIQGEDALFCSHQSRAHPLLRCPGGAERTRPPATRRYSSKASNPHNPLTHHPGVCRLEVCVCVCVCM